MSRLQRRPQVSETVVDDDLYLVHPLSQEIYHLDAIAAALWRLLEQPLSEVELLEAFAAAFPATDRQRLAQDLDAALKLLLDQDLIRRG